MLDSLVELVSKSDWTYVVVMAAVFVDAWFPLIPSETMIITAGVLSSQGHLAIELVLVASVAGAIVGDNLSYGVGRKLGRRKGGRLFRSEKAKRRLDKAAKTLDKRGWIVVIGRFIPGGRTATTFACGMIEMPWRRFLFFDSIGGTLWASYAAALGYWGGSTFENNLWKPLLVAIGTGALIAVAIEVVQHLLNRRAARAA